MSSTVKANIDLPASSQLSLLQAFRHMFRHISRSRRIQAIGVMGLMLLGAAAELVTIGAVVPFLTILASPGAIAPDSRVGQLLGTIGIEPSISLVKLTVIFCLAAVTAACVRVVLLWASQKFIFKVGSDLSVGLYRRILHQGYDFHVSRNSSGLLTVINKIQLLLTGMLKPVMQGISALVISLFIMTGLILINYKIALASILVFALIYSAVSFSTRRRLRSNSVIIAKNNAFRTQAVQEGLGGIRDILLDGAQPIYIRKFARIDHLLRDAQATNAFISAVPRYVIESVGMVLIAVLAFFLSREAGGLTASLPALGAMALGAQRLMPSLQLVYTGWAQATGNKALFIDVIELLDRPMPIPTTTKRLAAPVPFTRSIAFDKVGFRYSADGPEVISGLDLAIPHGARVGFIGKTGSGKSTIMDLLLGLLQPSSGRIEIDGQPLTPARVAGWQAQIAHVPQHIFLADISFAENIAFGVAPNDIDIERVRQAAVEADIHEVIEAQPNGYQTKIGERGVKLSGGQRQRIGIARALYKRSTVLILDEATSALDDATEATITAALNRLGRDITIVMIAHRVTTLRDCDILYRMEAGRLVERGSYDELVGALADERTTPADRSEVR